MTESIEKGLREEIKNDHNYIVSLRRHFHMNPEIAKVVVKLLIGAIAAAFGGTLLEHGAKDASKIKGWKNA